MDCCENKNIIYKNYENICINCGTIHDYKYINEISFRGYNMNISNILFYKKTIYKRRKYLSKKCFHIKEINNNIILFFDKSLEELMKIFTEILKATPINFIVLYFSFIVQTNYKSLEEIRKLYDMRRISISKYLNSIYYFYCNKSSINYEPILNNKKIIDLNDGIIKILEKIIQNILII